MSRAAAALARAAAALALVVSATTLASAAVIVPDGGMVIEGSTPEIVRGIDLAHAAGARWVSLAAPWAPLEPERGSYRTPGGPGSDAWTELEERVRYARSRGMSVELRLADAPGWASGREAGNDPPAPANLGAYGDFLRELAARLGPYVDAYTPWNEANLTTFWSPVDPADYVALQKVAYRSLKDADPTAIVLSTNIVGDLGYLRAAYRSGLAGHADRIGWTSYPSNGPPEATYVDARGNPTRASLSAQLFLRGLIDQYDPGRKVWIMEFGWSTCTPRCADYADKSVTEERQADHLVRAFEYRRRYLDHVTERIFWYALRDRGTNPTQWNNNHGLLRHDWTPKPSYAAFRSIGVDTAERPPGAGGPTRAPGAQGAPLREISPPPLGLPARASSRRGRVVIGPPTLRGNRGRLILSFRVRLDGGSSVVHIAGFRPRSWRPLTRVRLARSGRLAVRIPDRAYTHLRIRATVPGRRGWRAGRVVNVRRALEASRGVRSTARIGSGRHRPRGGAMLPPSP
jgi:hypothetical protein